MMNFYEFYTLLEGQAEDFVLQNPELQIAYDQGVKNINYLKWLLKAKEQEPLKDIIPLIFAFEKNKIRLPIKDIFQYKNPSLLRQEIEKLGKSKGEVSRQLKDSETTKLGEFGDWIIVMPHTRESSCQWGKGTTWCTAATQSGNLFLNYVARKDENIVLYYLINTKEDPAQNPNAKISIGFINGEPAYRGNGGVTVNAKNTGLDASKIEEILGNQYDEIMSALKEHSKSIEGKHPAKEQMEKIAQSKDPKILESYLQGMKTEEKEDFLEMLTDGYKLSGELLVHISKNYQEFLGKSSESIVNIIRHSSNENLQNIFDNWRKTYDENQPTKGAFAAVSHVFKEIIISSIQNSGIHQLLSGGGVPGPARDQLILSNKKNLIDRLNIIIPNLWYNLKNLDIRQIQEAINLELGKNRFELFDSDELSFKLIKKIFDNMANNDYHNINYDNVDQILRSLEKFESQYEIIKIIIKATQNKFPGLNALTIYAILKNTLGRKPQEVEKIIEMIGTENINKLSNEEIYDIAFVYKKDPNYQSNLKKILTPENVKKLSEEEKEELGI